MTPGRAGAALLVLTLITGAANLVATRDEVQTSNHRLRSVTATVAQLHAAEVSSCRQGNQTRADEIALWDHLDALATGPTTTARQRKEDNELLAYIRLTFAAKDCQAAYRLGG